MKKYSQEEIDIILKRHLNWLNEGCEGWEYMQADLSYIYAMLI